MSETLAQDRFAMHEPFLEAHQFHGEWLEVGSTKVLAETPREQLPHPGI